MESVTFIRAGTAVGEDTQGSPIPGPPIKTVSTGWAVAPASSTESSEEFGQQLIIGYALYKREPEDVTSFDRVIVRGEECAVVGQVADWRPRRSGPYGTVVNVKRGV